MSIGHVNANALSCASVGPATPEGDHEIQVAAIQSKEITDLLVSEPQPPPNGGTEAVC